MHCQPWTAHQIPSCFCSHLRKGSASYSITAGCQHRACRDCYEKSSVLSSSEVDIFIFKWGDRGSEGYNESKMNKGQAQYLNPDTPEYILWTSVSLHPRVWSLGLWGVSRGLTGSLEILQRTGERTSRAICNQQVALLKALGGQKEIWTRSFRGMVLLGKPDRAPAKNAGSSLATLALALRRVSAKLACSPRGAEGAGHEEHYPDWDLQPWPWRREGRGSWEFCSWPLRSWRSGELRAEHTCELGHFINTTYFSISFISHEMKFINFSEMYF